jgi:hypothetical protein
VAEKTPILSFVGHMGSRVLNMVLIKYGNEAISDFYDDTNFQLGI